MATKKRTKDTGEIAAIARREQAPVHEVPTMSIKTIVFIMCGALGVGTGGSYLGITQAAPDPKAVTKTQEDVSTIKTELAKLNVTLQGFADTSTRDKLEFERRHMELQRQLDKLQTLADDAREVKDLKRRVEALEKGGK